MEREEQEENNKMKKTKKAQVKQVEQVEQISFTDSVHKSMAAAIEKTCVDMQKHMAGFPTVSSVPITVEESLEIAARACDRLKAYLAEDGRGQKMVELAAENYFDWEFFHAEGVKMREMYGEKWLSDETLDIMQKCFEAGEASFLERAHYHFLRGLVGFRYSTMLEFEISAYKQRKQEQGKGIIH